MANDCLFNLRAVGKKKDVKKLINVFDADFDEKTGEIPLHLHRIFYFDIENSDMDEFNSYEDDDVINIDFVGSCAWSVYCCMFDGEFTYQKDDKTGTGTTIDRLSKDLNLDIEIFSEEIGMCFCEHFLIKHGEIIINDCKDFESVYIEEYNTYEEFRKSDDYNSKVTEILFNNAKKDLEDCIYLDMPEIEYSI